MVKECYKRPSKKEMFSIANRAKKVLRNHNFITSKQLARLLKINSQRAGQILRRLPGWYQYGDSVRPIWAREGYPL